MGFRIEAINKHGKSMQIFGNNEFPDAFYKEMLKQGVIKEEIDSEDWSFVVKDVMGIINAIEYYIKEQQEYFVKNKDIYYNKMVDIDNKRYQGSKVHCNSIFDLTNNFVPYRKDVETGYDEMPIWEIIELNKPSLYMFASYNFIEHIYDSLEEVGGLLDKEYRLKPGEKIVITGR